MNQLFRRKKRYTIRVIHRICRKINYDIGRKAYSIVARLGVTKQPTLRLGKQQMGMGLELPIA